MDILVPPVMKAIGLRRQIPTIPIVIRITLAQYFIMEMAAESRFSCLNV